MHLGSMLYDYYYCCCCYYGRIRYCRTLFTIVSYYCSLLVLSIIVSYYCLLLLLFIIVFDYCSLLLLFINASPMLPGGIYSPVQW